MGPPDDQIDRLLAGMAAGQGTALRPPVVEPDETPASVRPPEDILANAANELLSTILAAMRAAEISKTVLVGHGWAVTLRVGTAEEIREVLKELP